MHRLCFGALCLLLVAAPAAATEIGTCDCSGGTCSLYVGEMDDDSDQVRDGWIHVDDCDGNGNGVAGAVFLFDPNKKMVDSARKHPFNIFFEELSHNLAVAGLEAQAELYKQEREQNIKERNERKEREGNQNYEPPNTAFGVSGLGIEASYDNFGFASDTAIGGQKRNADIYGLDIVYNRDFGDWAVLASLPVSWGRNNGAFSALDDTSLGLVVVPSYHVLYQQVHGIKLDVSAVLGYDHQWYDDISQLTSTTGAFALSDIDNPSSVEAGLMVTAGWGGDGYAVAGQVSHIDIRNLSNQSIYGCQYSETNFLLGARKRYGSFVLGLDLSYDWLHGTYDGIDDSYGKAKFSAEYRLGGGGSFRLAVNRTIDNDDYHGTGVMLSYHMRFN